MDLQDLQDFQWTSRTSVHLRAPPCTSVHLQGLKDLQDLQDLLDLQRTSMSSFDLL